MYLLILIPVFLIGYLLLFYPFGSGPFLYRPPAKAPLRITGAGKRITVEIVAGKREHLEGWLYLPEERNCPVVIMAPGLTSTKECFIEQQAWAFVEKGIAVLSFDFRGFGGSEGMPRHWVSPERQEADYQLALHFIINEARRFHPVDIKRIALWGSSFSGGTALIVAAKFPDIVKAVIAQAPYLQNSPLLEPAGKKLMRFVALATADSVRAWIRKKAGVSCPPIYIPAFGIPGEFAFSVSRENISAAPRRKMFLSPFWEKADTGLRGGWENKMLARGLTGMKHFVPMTHLPEVSQPVYFIAAAEDDQVLPEYVDKAYHLVNHPGKKITRYNCGHYDLYLEPVAAQNAANQSAFLAEIFRTGEFSLLRK